MLTSFLSLSMSHKYPQINPQDLILQRIIQLNSFAGSNDEFKRKALDAHMFEKDILNSPSSLTNYDFDSADNGYDCEACDGGDDFFEIDKEESDEQDID